MANNFIKFYSWMLETQDVRTKDWFLLGSPVPIVCIWLLYLLTVWLGPKIMKSRQPINVKEVMIFYNVFMVLLSGYMFYEFLASFYLSGYSLTCQPVDYSENPLSLRMARVCWLYFFSKVIELIDTVFFIVKKSERQITFLHVYHHSTMLINWWLGATYVAGGQAIFMAILNTFVHVIMYSYYALAGLGRHMQKYLWWKKYITKLQLTQFVLVILHTAVNMMVECSFPSGYNYAVIIYSTSLIFLFTNFYSKTYNKVRAEKSESNSSGDHSNGSIPGRVGNDTQYGLSREMSNGWSNGVSNDIHQKPHSNGIHVRPKKNE